LPQTSQTLVTDACFEAKVPQWLSIAGRKLNLILAELCSYDLDVIRQTYQFNFNVALGSGPIPLPTNWLRANKNDVFYTILGVQYVMVPVTMAEFDAFVQQAGLAQYPEYYAVDNSPRQSGSAPNMYVWPPPSGAYPVTARYYSIMPDITTPETSSVIPWFSYERELYLQRRLVGEMMLMAGDDRAALYLNGETQTKHGTFLGASALLNRYLSNKDDSQAVKRVTLDRRLFGQPFDKLRNTKTIGW
jgi:hypothetical protein